MNVSWLSSLEERCVALLGSTKCIAYIPYVKQLWWSVMTQQGKYCSWPSIHYIPLEVEVNWERVFKQNSCYWYYKYLPCQCQNSLYLYTKCVTQNGSFSYFTNILTCRNCSLIYSFHFITKASQIYEIIQSIVFSTIIIATKSWAIWEKKEVLLPQKSPQDKKHLQFLHNQLTLQEFCCVHFTVIITCVKTNPRFISSVWHIIADLKLRTMTY